VCREWKVPLCDLPVTTSKILKPRTPALRFRGRNSKRCVDTDARNATHHSPPAIRVSSYIDHTPAGTPSGEAESHRTWSDIILPTRRMTDRSTRRCCAQPPLTWPSRLATS
jgi:hypothetical protein